MTTEYYDFLYPDYLSTKSDFWESKKFDQSESQVASIVSCIIHDYYYCYYYCMYYLLLVGCLLATKERS